MNPAIAIAVMMKWFLGGLKTLPGELLGKCHTICIFWCGLTLRVFVWFVICLLGWNQIEAPAKDVMDQVRRTKKLLKRHGPLSDMLW